MKKAGLILAILVFASASSFPQTIFIASGTAWKYSTGTDLGTTWKDTSYNDVSWSQGLSQLGYGDGDESTVIPSGPISNTYPTYYFRSSINVSNPDFFQALMLSVKRDDGIVVYVNGIEVFRDNMPAGTVSYNTLAITALGIPDESAWLTGVLSPAMLVNGTNVIAAEVHQANATSSDVTFDLQLTGGTPPQDSLIRGPYLQLGTSASIIFKWIAKIKTDTKVKYGVTSGNLNQSATNFFSSPEHSIQLTELFPNTKYYYSIGSAGQTLQGDTSNYFITAPLIGTEKTTRIWVTGDCGTAQTVQTKVTNAYQNFIGNNYTDIWLLLGDNAYNGGLDNEYQNKFFKPYMPGKVMKQTVLWPAPGNHDYNNSAALLESRTTPYFQIFTLPTAGEAGGLASGTEMYYSYDHANIHFISLDSYGTESGKKIFDTTGAQITWLKQDLVANTQKWTIIYWHHPPYTKGSHNSDTESELINIRNNVIKILDRYKVDLILCGHSHTYERSKIMKGHYGLENTYDSIAHNASSSSARYDGLATNSCPYIKSSNSPANEGIVYVVAGSAGKLGGTSSGYPHNAMHYSNSSTGGSLYIEVNGNRLDAKWITENGAVLDKFTILKDVNQLKDININEGENTDIMASWQGSYQWRPINSTSQTINVAPIDTMVYYVTDGSFDCIHDTFKVNVIPALTISGTVLTETGRPISGVTLMLSGDTTKSIVTGADGLYDFQVFKDRDYSITPSKNNDITTANGITTIDMALIQRHILQIQAIGSSYKIIAADVGANNSVSTLDLLLIRSVILSTTPTFPNGRLWEFVNSDYVFPNPVDPFPFEKTRTYNNISTNHISQNFIGIKLGDVNDSWDKGIP